MMLPFSGFWRATLVLMGSSAMAAPPLTYIQDTLYLADGSKFQGTAYIQWKSFDASDTSVVPMQNLTIRIVDGVLRAQLVPTTNAGSPAYYQVRFNSNGRTQFIENWSVPPSASVLRLKDIRIQGPLNGAVIPPVNATILVTDVSGLRDELDTRPLKGSGYSSGRAAIIDEAGTIESALGNSTDCVHVDGSSGPCGGSYPVFVDGETPSGLVNGSNTTFTLSTPPSPATSLHLYRNGLLQQAGLEYTLSASTIVFAAGAVPASGDTLTAWYRAPGTGSAATFADGEALSGVIDGVNATFTLSSTPNPAGSLQIFRNGLLQRSGADYTASGQSVNFVSGALPQPGDILQAWYRY